MLAVTDKICEVVRSGNEEGKGLLCEGEAFRLDERTIDDQKPEIFMGYSFSWSVKIRMRAG